MRSIIHEKEYKKLRIQERRMHLCGTEVCTWDEESITQPRLLSSERKCQLKLQVLTTHTHQLL